MKEAAHLQACGHCGQGLVQKGLEALSCLLGLIWVAAESGLELQRVSSWVSAATWLLNLVHSQH